MSAGTSPYSVQVCTNFPYVFSNGSNYQPNTCAPSASIYAVSPSACQVRTFLSQFSSIAL